MDSLKQYFRNLRTSPWWFVCILGAVIAVMLFQGMTEYVMRWGGSMFQVVSGGLLGFHFSRRVLHNNVSEIAPEDRARAALSQAIVVAAFALGVPLAV